MSKKAKVEKVENVEKVSFSDVCKKHTEASRTLRNEKKFDELTIERAYQVSKGVIEEHKLNKSNVFDVMSKSFDSIQPQTNDKGEIGRLDCRGKIIKKPQTYFSALCCLATQGARSTSSFKQDVTEISILRNRKLIKEAFPSFQDEILDIICKASYEPKRTSDV